MLHLMKERKKTRTEPTVTANSALKLNHGGAGAGIVRIDAVKYVAFHVGLWRSGQRRTTYQCQSNTNHEIETKNTASTQLLRT